MFSPQNLDISYDNSTNLEVDTTKIFESSGGQECPIEILLTNDLSQLSQGTIDHVSFINNEMKVNFEGLMQDPSIPFKSETQFFIVGKNSLTGEYKSNRVSLFKTLDCAMIDVTAVNTEPIIYDEKEKNTTEITISEADLLPMFTIADTDCTLDFFISTIEDEDSLKKNLGEKVKAAKDVIISVTELKNSMLSDNFKFNLVAKSSGDRTAIRKVEVKFDVVIKKSTKREPTKTADGFVANVFNFKIKRIDRRGKV